MRQGLAVGPLCALVNNNSRCYDDAAEFGEHLADTLAADLRVTSGRLATCLSVFNTDPECSASRPVQEALHGVRVVLGWHRSRD